MLSCLPGEAAVKALLTNSKQSIFKSEAFTKYVKKGDMSTAWNDFQALNPTNVRQKRLGGGVGTLCIGTRVL